jgi:hypothetical protein
VSCRINQVSTILSSVRGDRPKLALDVTEIQQRMVTRFINEAAFCLQDGVIENPVDGE